jgi:hypothetical protein
MLLLQKLSIESVYFNKISPDQYLVLSSHLYYIFLFLFGLLIFVVKLKYTNTR